MKLILSPFRDFSDDWRRGYVFLADSPEKGTASEGSEKAKSPEDSPEKKIEEILRNPLGLSLRQLKYIEKNIQTLPEGKKAEFKAQFQDSVAGYLLTLNAKETMVIPTRLLNGIYDSRILSGLLSNRLRSEIGRQLDTNRQEIKALLKRSKPEDWSDGEVVRACSMYSQIKDKAVKPQDIDEQIFRKLRDQLLQKGIPLLYRFEAHHAPDLMKKGKKENLEQAAKKQPALTTDEKVMLLEMGRIFGPQDWGITFHENWWKALSSQVTSELLGGKEDDSEKDSKESEEKAETNASKKDNPNYILAWELLDDFINNEDSWTKLNIEKTDISGLENLAKRARAAEFLNFADRQPLFLKSHLNALREIQEKKLDFLVDSLSGSDFLESLQNETDEIEELRNEIAKKEEDRKKTEDWVNRHLIHTYFSESEEKLYSQYDSQKEEIQKETQTAKDDLAKAKGKEEKEEQEKILSDLRSQLSEVENSFQSLKQKLEKKRASLEIEQDKKNITGEDTDESIGILTQKMQTIQELKKEVEKIDRKIGQRLNRNKKYIHLARFWENPGKWAEEIEENYWKELTKRFEEGKLRSADLEILFENEERFEELKKSRKDLEKIFSSFVNEKLEKALGKILDKKDDKYDVWLHILDEELNLQNIVGTELEKNIQETFSSGQNTREVFEGMLWNSRDKIFGKVREGLRGSLGEEKTDLLLRQWDRLHKRIETSEEVDNYDTFLNREQQRREDASELISQENETTNALSRKICDLSLSEVLVQSDISGEERNEVLNKLLLWDNLKDSEQRIDSRTDLKTEIERLISKLSPEKLQSFFPDTKAAESEAQKTELIDQLTERVLLEQTQYVRTHNFLEGQVIKDEERGNLFIPGRESLTQASVATYKERQVIQQELDDFTKQLSEMKEGYKKLPSLPESQIHAQKVELTQDLDRLLANWDSSEQIIRRNLQNMHYECQKIFSDHPDFVEKYLQYPQKLLGEQNSSVQGTILEVVGRIKEQRDKIKANQKRENKDADEMDILTGTEDFFWQIPELTQAFSSLIDFQNGFWAGESQKHEYQLKQVNKAARLQQKLGFFEDKKEGKTDFIDRFQSVQTDFMDHFYQYEKSVREVRYVVQDDLDSLSQEDFFQKYGFEKDYIRGVVESHETSVEEFEKIWKTMDQNAIEELLVKYDEGGESRVAAMQEIAKWEDTDEAAKNAQKMAASLTEWLRDYDSKKQSWWDRHFRNRNVIEFSLYDIYATVKKGIEANEVKWKRKSDMAVAHLGATFFGENNYFGKEYRRLGEESESQRIKEFETRYHDKPGWEIQKWMSRSKDPDEVRACINLLSEKGFLKWDDPMIWRALNKLQRAITFDTSADLQMGSYQIRNKVKQAASIVWSQEVFDEWDRNLDERAKKAEGGFAREFESLEHDPTARTEIMANMLQKWSRGETDDVDPARYAMFIRESFRLGKMNGQPDQRIYFMIMGVTTRNPRTGQSILSRDFFQRMDGEFLARFPHVDFFVDKASPKLNGRIVPEGTPNAEKRGWTYDDYVQWSHVLGDSEGSFNPTKGSASTNTERFFYHYIHMSEFARDRVQRMQRMSEKEGDHDDAWANFLEWKPRQVRTHLSRRSEGSEKSSPDWWRTFLSAFPTYMKYMYEYIQQGDAEWGNSKFWQDEREEVLYRIGERLQVGVEATQALLGNYISYGDSSRPMFYDKDEWKKKTTSYSISLMESKSEINSFLRSVFRAADDGSYETFNEVIDLHGSEYGKSHGDMKDNEEWKTKIGDKIKTLLTAKTGGKYFNDTSYIYKGLQAYMSEKNRSS